MNLFCHLHRKPLIYPVVIYDRVRNVKHTVLVNTQDHDIEIPENGFVELVGIIDAVEWDMNTAVPAITFFVSYDPAYSQAGGQATP